MISDLCFCVLFFVFFSLWAVFLFVFCFLALPTASCGCPLCFYPPRKFLPGLFLHPSLLSSHLYNKKMWSISFSIFLDLFLYLYMCVYMCASSSSSKETLDWIFQISDYQKKTTTTSITTVTATKKKKKEEKTHAKKTFQKINQRGKQKKTRD